MSGFVQQHGMKNRFRRNVGWEDVTDTGIGNGENGLVLIGFDLSRQARGGYFRIMNAAPQMLAPGHMAGLAGLTLLGLRAGFSFLDGIFQGLAVDRLILWELMTGGTKRRTLEILGAHDAAMWGVRHPLPNDTGLPLGRAEKLVVPDMAPGAGIACRGDPLRLSQMCFPLPARCLERLCLLSQRGMAIQAGLRLILRIGQQLADQPRRKRLGVQRALPFLELVLVARGAGLGIERGFDLGRFGRSLALSR